MKLLATDLDRTLLPNGDFPYDNSMLIFKRILLDNKDIKLAFVSGRHLSLVKSAIKKYNTPIPDFIISDVGTTIYKNEDGSFLRDNLWGKYIEKNMKNWNIESFKGALSSVSGLRLQEKEKQNIFKLSYFIDDLSIARSICKKVENIVKDVCNCKDALIIYSVDETIGQGLLDILPNVATKEKAIEYLRNLFKLNLDDVLYCGDSGNDILPLTQGYNAVLVKNTISVVRKEVKRIAKKKNISNKIYIAKGYKNLNGYYTSGIIEGLINFGFVKENYFLKLK